MVNSTILHRLADTLRRHLQKRCTLCSAALSGTDFCKLCPGCYQHFARISQPCYRCGIPLHSGQLSLCGRCIAAPPPFSRCITPFRYASPVSDVITQFKHHGNLAYGQLLAELLSEHFLSAGHFDSIDALIPVPLHQRQLRKRGFNQSAELARVLSRRLDIPLNLHAIQRCQDTPSQQQLDKAQRLANLRQAFRLNRSLQGQRLAIIDDVVTTTATASALSRLCLDQGAREVQVWALARTVLEH